MKNLRKFAIIRVQKQKQWLAEQRRNCCDNLSADVRQMLYGFSSVSDLFNICGLPFRANSNQRKLLKEGEYIHKSCDADPATIEHVVSMRAR